MKFTGASVALLALLTPIMAAAAGPVDGGLNVLEARYERCPCYPHCGCPSSTTCQCVGGTTKAPCFPNCGCAGGLSGTCVVN